MVKCSVLSCGQVYTRTRSTPQGNEPRISFHKIPRDDEQRQKWLASIGRENWTAPLNSFVCSLHFKKSDFIDCQGRRIFRNENVVPEIVEITPTISKTTKKLTKLTKLTKLVINSLDIDIPEQYLPSSIESTKPIEFEMIPETVTNGFSESDDDDDEAISLDSEPIESPDKPLFPSSSSQQPKIKISFQSIITSDSDTTIKLEDDEVSDTTIKLEDNEVSDTTIKLEDDKVTKINHLKKNVELVDMGIILDNRNIVQPKIPPTIQRVIPKTTTVMNNPPTLDTAEPLPCQKCIKLETQVNDQKKKIKLLNQNLRRNAKSLAKTKMMMEIMKRKISEQFVYPKLND